MVCQTTSRGMNAGINTVVCIVVVIVATEPAPDCDATAEIRDVPYQRRAAPELQEKSHRRHVLEESHWGGAEEDTCRMRHARDTYPTPI